MSLAAVVVVVVVAVYVVVVVVVVTAWSLKLTALVGVLLRCGRKGDPRKRLRGMTVGIARPTARETKPMILRRPSSTSTMQSVWATLRIGAPNM